MGDLPGPEKPPSFGPAPSTRDWSDRPLDPNELMAQFRALMGQTEAAKSNGGRGGQGPYDGRSGRFLRGRVRDRHKMAVSLQVCGWTNNEIARAMRYTPSRVSIILNSKNPELLEHRRVIAERVANSTIDLSAKIQLAAPHALDAMIALVDSQDENVAHRSAKDILDRAGYSPVKKQINLGAQVPYDELTNTLDKINEANEVALEHGEWAVKTVPRKSGAA